MAKWEVSPTLKKSIVEFNYLTKDDETIVVSTVWRWGTFYVYTEDDNPPDIYPGIDIYNCDYETELVETIDGCHEEISYDTCTDETREWLENFFEEGNSYFELEEHGWVFSDCEMVIECDSKVERVTDEVV